MSAPYNQGQRPYGYAPQHTPAAYAPPVPQTQCRFCGNVPAVDASFIITPITVLINAARHGKVASLQPPRPPAYGPSGRPMDPGAPLLTRPAALIGLSIPVFIVVLVVALIAYQAVTTV